MATPDVRGIAEALAALHQQHGSEQAAARSTAAQERIRAEFSGSAVALGFDSLIADALLAHAAAAALPAGKSVTVVAEATPRLVDWDTPWTLLAPPEVTINEARVEMVLQNSPELEQAHVAFVPALYADGTPVPFLLGGDRSHPHLPVLMRTHMFAHAQVKRKSGFRVRAARARCARRQHAP